MPCNGIPPFRGFGFLYARVFFHSFSMNVVFLILKKYNILDILASLLVSHPFYGTKKMVWWPYCMLFSGLYGVSVISISLLTCFDSLMDLVPSTTFWCKTNHPFKS